MASRLRLNNKCPLCGEEVGPCTMSEVVDSMIRFGETMSKVFGIPTKEATDK